MNVISKRCGHPGCTKQPLYGVEVSKKAEFCAGHKKEGMVNINNNKRCGHPGCNKQPSYGVEGSNMKEFCAQHKKDGMINVNCKRCGHPSCNKVPSFWVEGSKMAEFCAKHKKAGMVRRRSQQGFVGKSRNVGDVTESGRPPISRSDGGARGVREHKNNAPLQTEAEPSSASKRVKRTRQAITKEGGLLTAANPAFHEAAGESSSHEEGLPFGQRLAGVKVEESAVISAFGTAEAVR